MAYNSPHYQGDHTLIKELPDGRTIHIPAKALNIIWGRDGRYWSVPDKDDMPVELLQVCWLEVSVSVDKTDPKKDYEVGFNVSLKADAFGWNKYPVYLMMKRSSDAEFTSKKFFINGNGERRFKISGKLKSEKSTTDPKIYFGLYEVWSGKWKGGLVIHDAFVKEIPAA